MIQNLFCRILTDPPIEILSKESLNLERLEAIYQENQTGFWNEYQNNYRQFKESISCGTGSETASNSLILLRFIEINILLKLDCPLLADALVILADMVQLLATKYETETYENRWGTVIAYKINGKMYELLRREPDGFQEFIVGAVSQISVTNTTLALWNHCALKHYGVRVSRKVTSALKAMYLFDCLLGRGICDLLLKNSREATEKKLKAFTSIGLQTLSEKILAYYSCKTGNEKKRFLSDMESYIGDFNIIEAVNIFLSDR